MPERRKPTVTSAFGVGRRENHDSTPFYARFEAPTQSADDQINTAAPGDLDRIICGDSRHMGEVADSSVALVVTSPPYFAGKLYEEAVGEGGVPATYIEYLDMLTDVFAECVRTLEPGGRIAVNVANLGRRPYRSLAADVTGILQDRLHLLLRGEIIWLKARGAGGSCAWGSFQSPANPVLRDLTERIIVASKGRFDRAVPRRARAQAGLPSEISIFADDFMEATTDVWEMAPESATRVGHPAPFPVELPQRLIELYTYRDDVVLDPFMGSGSTAVASLRTGRHYLGYDSEPLYVAAADDRVTAERSRLMEAEAAAALRPRVSLPAVPEPADDTENYQARAVREGRKARDIAVAVLRDTGFEIVAEGRRLGNGVEVNLVVRDQLGADWYVDVSGAFTSTRAGLRRMDTVWKALGKAAVLRQSRDLAGPPLLLLSTDLPVRGTAGASALEIARGTVYWDAVEMLSADGQARLSHYALHGQSATPEGELLLPSQ